MNDRERTIAEFQKKIRDNERSIKQLSVGLGNSLFQSGIGELEKFQEPYRAAQDEKEALEKNQEIQGEIRRILERKGAIRYQLKQVNEKLQDLEKDNSQYYQTLGKAVYTAYNSGQVSGEGFAALFSELIKQIVDLRKTEREIDDARRSLKEKAFLEKVVDQGKIAILSGNRALKEKTLDREYWKAGKDLCSSDLLSAINYEPVREIAAPCMEKKAEIDAAQNEQEKLLAEDEALDQTLENLDAAKNPQRRLQELERTLHDVNEKLKASLAALGGAYLEDRPKDISVSEDAKKVITEIESYRKQNEKLRKDAEKLEASLQAEELGTQISELNRRVVHIEEQIRKSQEEVNSIKEEIAEKERERKKLEKLAGTKQAAEKKAVEPERKEPESNKEKNAPGEEAPEEETPEET